MHPLRDGRGRMKTKPYWAMGLMTAACVLGLDRLSKWWLLEPFAIAEREPVTVASFFNLVMVWNPGISFGLLGGNQELGRWLLIGFSVIVVAILVAWLFRIGSGLMALGLGFVIGGAIGNIWDRVVWGAVADFFDFHVAGYHFWAFNIADAGISTGVAFLLYDAFWGSGREAV